MRGRHKCFICEGKMQPYFSKTFTSWGVGTFDYETCEDCGFSICQNLIDMPTDDWTELNERFHTEIYKYPGDPFNRAGRLRGQADAIGRMVNAGLIPKGGPLVDWGSGVGDLAIKMLERRHHMYSYDKYITPLANPYEGDPAPRSCSFVIASAVYEHLRDRAQMNAIEVLVADDGVLAIHMAIPKVIPKDPNWVYLLPVHCAFYTCESMRRLMQQWGYKATVYCREADTWFLFKRTEDLKEKIASLNAAHGYDYLVYSDGFIDRNATEFVGKQVEPKKYLYVGARKLDLNAKWTSRQWVESDFARSFVDDNGKQFAPATFDGVYSDLILERMEPTEFDKYAALVKSVLKPGGVHRVVTANLNASLDNAASGSWQDLPWVKKAGLTTKAEYINACFRNWGHKYLYDAKTAMKRLHDVGLRNISEYQMHKGRLEDLCAIDSEKHRIYVEAAI